MTLPTLKQLRYFLALVEFNHFGRAAESCFVSQSAFSIAIRDLENLLATQLVDRTNRRVTITDIGREIAIQARLTLNAAESLVEMAQSSQLPLSGKLKLGVIPTIAPFLLPRFLPELRKQYPELQLYLVEDTTARVHQKLLSGELDLIIIALPFALRGVEISTLFKDPFLLACRTRSTLIDPLYYNIDKLEQESILLLEDGHCLRDHALAACQIRDLNQVSRFSASSLLTLIEMVDADIGLTFLPEMAQGSPLLKGTRVKTYPLKEKSFREIGIAWRKGSRREKEFRLLGEFLTHFHQNKIKHQ
ncbi:MAG: hydrogen peroxide-inducible genes activator [Chromatiales bacterium]|nr:hydrogen peroxide-inducible genes activator [Chromatiales bacterium]